MLRESDRHFLPRWDDHDRLRVPQNPVGTAWIRQRGYRDKGTPIYIAHLPGLDSPVMAPILDDTEGVNPKVPQAKPPRDEYRVLEVGCERVPREARLEAGQGVLG